MSNFKKPIKSLGQNFLKDQKVGIEMVNKLNIIDKDLIVEIGGGRGALTTLIAERIQKLSYTKLKVFEIDNDLVDYLKDRFNFNSNIEIIHENFLQSELNYNQHWKLFGAIPYYITSPIIHKFLKLNTTLRPEKVILLIQKEVGDKLVSKVPDASYWTHITHGYKVSKVAIVKRDAFKPVPKVDSMIVLFEKSEEESLEIDKIGFEKWSKFLHRGYRNPRKMLNKAFEKDLLTEVGIDPALRPQNISTKEWLNLYDKIASEK